MSKKSMVDRLQKKREKKQRAHRGVIAVLSQKEEIAEALEKGFTMREIYELMIEDGKMPVTYAAFTRLVNKYIKNLQKEHPPGDGSKLPKGARQTFEKKRAAAYNPDDYDVDNLY